MELFQQHLLSLEMLSLEMLRPVCPVLPVPGALLMLVPWEPASPRSHSRLSPVAGGGSVPAVAHGTAPCHGLQGAGSQSTGCGEQSPFPEQPRTEACWLDWGRGRFPRWG